MLVFAVGGGAHLNYCMIATGNHRYLDSLRDAPRPARYNFANSPETYANMHHFLAGPS